MSNPLRQKRKSKDKPPRKGLFHHPQMEALVEAFKDFQRKHNELCSTCHAMSHTLNGVMQILLEKEVITDDDLRKKFNLDEEETDGGASSETDPAVSGDRAGSDVSDDSVDHGTSEDAGGREE